MAETGKMKLPPPSPNMSTATPLISTDRLTSPEPPEAAAAPVKPSKTMGLPRLFVPTTLLTLKETPLRPPNEVLSPAALELLTPCPQRETPLGSVVVAVKSKVKVAPVLFEFKAWFVAVRFQVMEGIFP